MRRILFVDNEPKFLEALMTILRPQQAKWDMAFVPSGQAALGFLETTPFDAIVTDLHTPGVSGTSLLTCARERFPEVIRIGLSEQVETLLQEVPVAHQFLTKRCDLAELRVAVERACKQKDLLDDKVIRHTVGALGELPSVPRIYQKLTRALEDPEVPLNDIAGIVEQDVAISAKLLRLVNSAFHRTVQDIVTVEVAVRYLGLNMIKHLVLSMEVFHAFEGTRKIAGFSLEALQSHSQLTAKIAACLPLPRHVADAAIVGALLHDVGKLVLAWKMPGRFERFLATAREQNRPLYQVEQELCGVTHAEIGAYLLGLWGLPYSITEAVAHHHVPALVPHRHFDALGAVYVANLLAHGQATPVPGHAPEAHDPIDLHFLQDLGVADQLPSWQAMVAQQAGACPASHDQGGAIGEKGRP